MNLAASLAAAEQPTLLIDTDPQANATSGLGINPQQLTKTIYEVMVDGIPPAEATMKTELAYLEMIPSHINLVGAEIEMIEVVHREKVLLKALEAMRRKYTYVVIDCPPSLGLLTLNALTAADSVLIPVQCEYYALEGLGQLLNTISIVKKHLNQLLDIEGVLLTMYDSRLRLSNQVASEVRRYFGDKVFQTIITRNVRLSEAPSHGKPVLLYDALSIGTKNYMDLATEILRRDGILAEPPAVDVASAIISPPPQSAPPSLPRQTPATEPPTEPAEKILAASASRPQATTAGSAQQAGAETGNGNGNTRQQSQDSAAAPAQQQQQRDISSLG